MDRSDLRRLTLNLLQWIAAPIALYYTASWLLEHLDPLKQRNDVARKQSAKTLQRLQKSLKDGHTRLKDITQHEIVIMSEVITPEELNVKFEGPPPHKGTTSLLPTPSHSADMRSVPCRHWRP